MTTLGPWLTWVLATVLLALFGAAATGFPAWLLVLLAPDVDASSTPAARWY
jgi:hypothetical protein